MSPTGDARLFPHPDTSVWVLGSGKIGHEVHSIGLARALGLKPEIKPVRPRGPFALLAPFGPADPREATTRPGGLLAPPYPDIAIAAGRHTIPALRYLKRASRGRVFTVCMQDPRVGVRAADAIWAPEHDSLRGENVIVTLTSPHGLGADALEDARRTPDPRIAALRAPRVAMILGGPSAHHRFEPSDIAALARIAADIVAVGHSLAVTPSRRTPPEAVVAIRLALAGAGPARAFVWDGAGANPYVHMLALADAIVVTADSANMMGEALAAGVPAHIYEPSGGHRKMSVFLDRLVAEGLVRRWSGGLEVWPCRPVDATQEITAEVARRYAAFRGG